jgi:hypothetical protein
MIHLEIDYKFLKAPDVRNFINQQTLFSKEWYLEWFVIFSWYISNMWA